MKCRTLIRAGFTLGLLMILFSSLSLWETSPHRVHGDEDRKVALALGRLPAHFIENQGQREKEIKFYLHSPLPPISFTEDQVVLAPRGAGGAAIRQRFLGRSEGVKIRGARQAGGRVHHLSGNDPSQWRTDIPTYQEIIYEGLYPGIDLAFSGTGGGLKSEFRVAPGADYRRIVVAYAGTEGLVLSDAGDLVIRGGGGEMKELKPYLYQEIDGVKREVGGRYVVEGDRYRFEVAPYDKSRELVIDPELVFSTYLGGIHGDVARDIAVDSAGNVYVIGTTGFMEGAIGSATNDFPTLSPYQSYSGQLDVFVTKIAASGESLIYSTYLGGLLQDYGQGIAVDASGNAFVTGSTHSTNFPVVSAYQAANAGRPASDPGPTIDVFVSKLDPSGSRLLYSTYLGGLGLDVPGGIAVDSSGNAYVVGRTSSTNFPTAAAIQGAHAVGNDDAFVTKLNSLGSDLVYSTYLGGGGEDEAADVVVDGFGCVYVAGRTASTDFPVVSAFQSSLQGPSDGFVTKIDASGSSWVYSTYLGGGSLDTVNGIAVDASWRAYVTGTTHSINFPTVAAFQPTINGSDGSDGGPSEIPYFVNQSDAFVAKLENTGASLIYSSFLGGDQSEEGHGIAIDSTTLANNAYVAGTTNSSNYHVISAVQSTLASVDGSPDIFLTKINGSLTSMMVYYSTYLGGTGVDHLSDVAVDSDGNAYVAGQTQSTDFPVARSYQSSLSSTTERDAFIAKIGRNPGRADAEEAKSSREGASDMKKGAAKSAPASPASREMKSSPSLWRSIQIRGRK